MDTRIQKSREDLLAEMKHELELAIAGNFIMRRAYLESEIKKLEKQLADKG